MEKQAVIRRVGIAVSVFFGVLTLALCVLWVRSYFVEDSFTLLENNTLTRFGFNRGSVYFINIGTRGVGNAPWNHQSRGPNSESPAYQWHWRDGHTAIFVPLLFFVAAFSGCASIPLGITHFSLRTLFIATTLVAVGLGLVVWAGR